MTVCRYGTIDGAQQQKTKSHRMSDENHQNEGRAAAAPRKIGTLPLAVLVFYTVSGTCWDFVSQ